MGRWGGGGMFKLLGALLVPVPSLYEGFHKCGYPKMVDLEGKILLTWMSWGYPHFRKPPYTYTSLGSAL